MPVLIILFILLLLGIVFSALFYLVTRFRRFSFIENSAHPLLYACVVVLVLLIPALFSLLPTMVVILHLVIFWALSDFVGFCIQKARKRSFYRYYQGVVALLVTVLYMSFAWYSAQHVFQTDYTVKTQKDLGTDSVRVVLIADSHLGEIMSAERFAQELEKIQAVSPDLVVIAGDFVDDDTSREDMTLACRALGELKTTYGVYFVYGNHDKGYFRSRDFTTQDLQIQLEENGVTILEDEAVLLNDSIYLIGRQDRSVEERAEISELVDGLDHTKYTIVLNHQPDDYENETGAEVDLVLSGHTHGGHIFPLGVIGYVFGANDQVYGIERQGNTNFVVTSGISGWGIPFKTVAISEFVVIDIENDA